MLYVIHVTYIYSENFKYNVINNKLKDVEYHTAILWPFLFNNIKSLRQL